MPPATLINAFEVPPGADEAFIADWRHVCDFVAAREAFAATALHRALRPDAEFRFVNVARVDSPRAWQEAVDDPGFPAADLPFRPHPGLYEVVREHSAPEGAGGVVLINLFEVPADADAQFLPSWDGTCDVLVQLAGYLGTRLHRSLAPSADFRFVNIARWSSPLAFSKAIQRPEFQQAAAAIPFPAHPSLYQVVSD